MVARKANFVNSPLYHDSADVYKFKVNAAGYLFSDSKGIGDEMFKLEPVPQKKKR